MREVVARFEASLDRLDVSWDRTTAGGFPETLAGAIDPPAVGAPLPFDDLSLDSSAVTVDPTPDELRTAATGVTAAGFGIAEYGTLAVRSDAAGTEPVSLYPPRHVAVLRASDVIPDVPTAIDLLSDDFAAGRDSVVLATGPSATADMGALVRGVHGPREVHVIVVTDA